MPSSRAWLLRIRWNDVFEALSPTVEEALTEW